MVQEGSAFGFARAQGLVCLESPGEGRVQAEVRPSSHHCGALAAALGAAWG